MKKSVVSLFALVVMICPQASSWDQLRAYGQGIIDLEYSFQYFLTGANYSDEGGSFEQLPSGYGYQLMTHDFGLRWSISDRWAVLSKVHVGFAEAEDPVAKRTHSNISGVTLATDWIAKESKSWELVPELFVFIPTEDVNTRTDHALISEGVLEFGGQLIGRLVTGSFLSYASGGYTHRDQGRSGLLTYSIGSEYVHTHFSIGAGLQGFTSVYDDEDSDQPQARNTVLLQNGSSKKFFGVNPDLTEALAWYRADAGRTWGLKLGAGLTVTGKNSAQGEFLFANLNYRFQGPKLKSTPVAPPRIPRPENEKFQEDLTDGVDQSLFDSVDPRRKKKSTPESIQKELDDTEMKIELRSLRKKRN